jgi:hypothetical protein
LGDEDGMGKAKGLVYMKALARQQLHIPGSRSVMRVQLMLAGESAIAIAARVPSSRGDAFYRLVVLGRRPVRYRAADSAHDAAPGNQTNSAASGAL